MSVTKKQEILAENNKLIKTNYDKEIGYKELK